MQTLRIFLCATGFPFVHIKFSQISRVVTCFALTTHTLMLSHFVTFPEYHWPANGYKLTLHERRHLRKHFIALGHSLTL